MPIIRRATCYLFDLDGTLVDSPPLHGRAFRRALAEHAPHLLASFDEESVRGKSTRDALADAGIRDPRELTRLAAEKQRLYREAVRDGQLEPIAGAVALLDALRDRGRRLFLVTSGSRASVKLALEATGLRDFFDGIVTSDDVDRAKPAPDGFLACLDRFSLPPRRSVVVEDAPSGVDAARAAGLAVIGINNPAVAGAADLYFESPGEMRDWALATLTNLEIVECQSVL